MLGSPRPPERLHPAPPSQATAAVPQGRQPQSCPPTCTCRPPARALSHSPWGPCPASLWGQGRPPRPVCPEPCQPRPTLRSPLHTPLSSPTEEPLTGLPWPQPFSREKAHPGPCSLPHPAPRTEEEHSHGAEGMSWTEEGMNAGPAFLSPALSAGLWGSWEGATRPRGLQELRPGRAEMGGRGGGAG